MAAKCSTVVNKPTGWKLYITAHAFDRWDERDGVHQLKEAAAVAVPYGPSNRTCDFLLHDDMVFVVRNKKRIVTCITKGQRLTTMQSKIAQAIW